MGHREAIGTALELTPSAIRERLRHVQFLTGTDPLYVGLHRQELASFGRTYRSIAHYVSPHYGATDGEVTIVLPVPATPETIIHELGHALDETLGFAHSPAPVSRYAKVNRVESFAEAWTAWISERLGLPWLGYERPDPETAALFESLAA